MLQDMSPKRCIFLSTPSARRATGPGLDPGPGRMISIHALREEGDPGTCSSSYVNVIFLSTPSARRATALDLAMLLSPLYFYPRPPRGGRRSQRQRRGCRNTISIHALREEGDM